MPLEICEKYLIVYNKFFSNTHIKKFGIVLAYIWIYEAMFFTIILYFFFLSY
jgi:hypothetical protein